MLTYVISFNMNHIFIFDTIARSAGEILSVSVNTPCVNDYCTFYKGTDARIEFTFTLSTMIFKRKTKLHSLSIRKKGS
jgi:hypothetical protein